MFVASAMNTAHCSCWCVHSMAVHLISVLLSLLMIAIMSYLIIMVTQRNLSMSNYAQNFSLFTNTFHIICCINYINYDTLGHNKKKYHNNNMSVNSRLLFNWFRG